MQDTWLTDFDSSKHKAYFAASENGWSNDEYGLAWLKVFDKNTKQKPGYGPRDRRLLILDGHSSHVNMKFIDYADRNRIILAILPPHSTHRLQPLDVGIFGPLASAYSKHLDLHIRSGMGYIGMTKRDFWRIFHAAWEESLTSDNIKAAFAATGIYPHKPEKVLKIFKVVERPVTPPDKPISIEDMETPTTARGVRRLIKSIHEDQVALGNKVQKMIRGYERSVFEKEIVSHELGAFKRVVGIEKQRRRRGKAMGLFDKSQPSAAQFFSPTKVAEVRKRNEELQNEKQDQEAQKQHDKLQQAILREEKAMEVAERKAAREAARLEAKKHKELEAAAKKAQREKEKKERQVRDAQKKREQKEQALARKVKAPGSKVKRPVVKAQTTRAKTTKKTTTKGSGKKASKGVPGPLPESPPPIESTSSTTISNGHVISLPERPKAAIQPTVSRSGRTIKPSMRLQDF